MNISEETKAKIEAEFKEWEAQQYAGKSKEERQKMAQFFTPPVLSIKMLEKFDSVKDKDILDPAAGAGGLLVVAIFAGADPERVYGIELDPKIAHICRVRLAKHGVLRHHIHVGNALDSNSYEFPESKKKFKLSLSRNGKVLVAKLVVSEEEKTLLESSMSLTDANGKLDEMKAKKMHEALNKLINKEIEGIEKSDKNICILDKLFKKVGLEEI